MYAKLKLIRVKSRLTEKCNKTKTNSMECSLKIKIQPHKIQFIITNYNGIVL